jgi:integrase
LAVADSLRTRVLRLAYGCGLRASEVVRLKVKHIDSAQKIIRKPQAPLQSVGSPLLIGCTKHGPGS